MEIWTYARKSSEDEDRQIQSIDAQNIVMHQFIERKKYIVTRKFEEAHSAWSEKKRPIFTKMIQEAKMKCENGNSVIIVSHKVDRITRNIRDFTYITEANKLGVKFEFINEQFSEDSAGEFNFGLQILMAQRYSANLSEEVKKGQMTSISKGYYPGQEKVGYICTKKENSRSAVKGVFYYGIKD